MIVRAEGKLKMATVMMGIGMITNIIVNYNACLCSFVFLIL